MKLNRKGYMTIEIILASVITFVIAFFLIDLTMKLSSNTDDAYADTILTTDKVLIINNVKDNLEKDMAINGNIEDVSCDENDCKITMNNGVNVSLSITDNILKYSGGETYTKEIDSSLTNLKLTSSSGSGYYNFKITGDNIFIDENYDMNINVYNMSVPILAPSSSWYKGSNKTSITKIVFVNKYTVTGTEDESWNAAINVGGEGFNNEIMCYRTGTVVTVVGNGTGKIYANSISDNMFSGFTSLEDIDFGILDTSMVTTMYRMFMACESLTSLDLSNFGTNNVIDMSSMFVGCYELKKLDLSNFDTSNVINMTTMFSDCLALEEINFGENFDTSNVTNMRGMFQKCEEISSLNLSGFNTSKVENMSHMFNKCSNLKTLDFGENFDTSSVTDMSWMFTLCKSLENIDLSGFNTSNVTNMGGMFNECYSLTELDLSSFDTSNVTIMYGIGTSVEGEGEVNVGMFYLCENLTTIYVSNLWNVSKVTSDNSINMFAGAVSLKGGADTEYNHNYVDVTYARVDDPSSGKPGYLTYKALN